MSTMSELRYLEYLKLVADQLEESVIEAGGFPKLLRLCLQLHGPTNSNILVEIKEGALPKLVALQLLFKGLNGPSGINIAHLNSLMEVTLHPDQTAELDKWQRAAKGHPNRPSIELLATADPKEINVMENSTTQGKPRPDIVTQKPLPEHSIPPSGLKKANENNGVLNCSREIEKVSLGRDCSVTSADPRNVVSGANLTELHMDPNMTEEYEHGKAFLPDYALIKSPWQMKFHEWYMEASKKGLKETIVHVPAEVYYTEEPSTIVVDFSDMHRMFCLQMLDVNLMSVWCLMQYCHAQKLGIEIGFLNPLLIAQPQHLDPENHEQCRNKTTAYIGRVMFEMQNKDCIYAPYTFNHHFICIMLYPKLGEMVVLDSLDCNPSTYKEFINIIQNGYKLYVHQGGIHNNEARENMIVHTKLRCHKQPPSSVLCGYYVCEFLRISGVYTKNNPEDLLKILLTNCHLTDEAISKICSDMCFFILKEICHTCGQFFSKDSDLATKEKYRFLREWNMTEM